MTAPNQPRPPSAFGRYFAEEGAKGSLAAFVSTITVMAIIVIGVGRTENWPVVKRTFFDLEIMARFDQQILRGFLTNVWLFMVGQVAILMLALLIAFMRSLKGPAFLPLRLLATIFIDFFRGIPIILGLLLFGFGIPALRIEFPTFDIPFFDLPFIGGMGNLGGSSVFWGLVVVVLSYSAYTAEVYRSGIDAVPDSQRLSAASLGLTQVQALRYAVLPQAVRNVIPALLNGFVSLQKDVALLAVLGVREAVREAQIATGRTFNYSPYVVATALFLAISIPSARFADWYSARDRARRSQGVG